MNSSFDRVTDGKDEWLTPPSIIQALGPFDLDPCSPINRPWDTAAKHLTINDDGLSAKWEGFVWCNPPYGKEGAAWLAKCAEHGNCMALIFARTDTNAFFDHIWSQASALLFLRRRLAFHHVDGTKGATAGAPSVLVAYGDEAANRLRHCGLQGAYVNILADTVNH